MNQRQTTPQFRTEAQWLREESKGWSAKKLRRVLLLVYGSYSALISDLTELVLRHGYLDTQPTKHPKPAPKRPIR